MDEEEYLKPRSRKRWALYGTLGVLVLIPLAIGIAWAQRKPIAHQLIYDELAKRGVPATFNIKRVGTKLQRIEKIVIGDPNNPDLTADWAEIDTGISLSGVVVKAVRASGVRVKGQLVGSTLKLGAVDKLLPAPTSEPFTLPDMDLKLADARMRLDTEFGPLGARLDGAGNFAGNFEGKLALVTPHLERADCAGDGVTAYLDLKTEARKISIDGPIRAKRIGCGANRAEGITLALNTTLTESLDSWAGGGAMTAARASAPGAGFTNVALEADFAGDKDSTSGRIKADMGSVAFAGGSAGQTGFNGTYRFSLADADGPSIESSGIIAARGLRPNGANLRQMTSFGKAGAGTPAAPVIASLVQAVERLGAGSNGTARYALAHERGDGQLRLNGIDVKSVSGAKLSLAGKDPVRYVWRDGGLFVSGVARLAGGGFPTSDVQLAGGDGRWSGTARIAPMVAGETRIALPPVQFSVRRGGTQIETIATIDGRMGTTRFVGLQLPVSLRPGAMALAGCRPLTFEKLDVVGFNLTKTTLNTCFVGQEARFAAPRIAGRYGDASFALTANSARYNLTTQAAWVDAIRVNGRLGSAPFNLIARNARYGAEKRDFAMDQIDLALGQKGSETRLDLKSITGGFEGPGAVGRFGGASGTIGTVPLIMSDGDGRWRFANGTLSLNGSVGVADRAAEARFMPLVSNNFTLRYAGNRITAQGLLTEPLTGMNVSSVDLIHNLSNGTGRAVLDVMRLTFGPNFQPEQLTGLTLGVVALVEGSVAGRGEIRWNPNGVTSDGRFGTEGLNFAAAFGPVRQMKGDIVFSDLLGLETPPGQTVSIAEINSGVQVIDGLVRYRLLAGQKVEVEGGRWPFSGGELILEPTVFDMSETAERRLTFRVVGMDAAQFVNALEFENIVATGTFDGVIPMVFDKDGGRIEAGNLIVRETGGTLSYVGEVSKENLGTFGTIAFDALKSIKYNRLSIDLGGALDGEMVSQIRFAGVNQIPIVPGRAKMPLPIKVKGLSGIPFIFNITIKAPFRGLLRMATDIQDPTRLIEDEVEKDRRRQEELNTPKTGDTPNKPVQQ
jgi:translocation and assembly module TamB